jgi:hypothetical protein
MKKLSKTSYVVAAILFSLPFLTLAQDGLFGVLATVRQFIAALVPLIIGIAVIYFLFGVLKYVVAKDSDSQKEARSIMVMGIIVLFVMVSVWGLVNILQDTFDIDNSGPINPRLIP